MAYKVTFQFRNELGGVSSDFLNNNGKGFTHEDAENVARQLKANGNKAVQVVEFVPINPRLSVKGCWKMVNAIQNASTPKEVRERCDIAEEWLVANTVITSEEYNDLMMTLTYLFRESYHTA